MGYVLGIWDGHDSGAALLQDEKILFAINEERLTRRKLEVHFPELSIEACLNFAKVKKEEINTIAAATYDLAKTLTRLFPGLKENYYQIRRKKNYSPYVEIQKKWKLFLTGIRPTHFTKKISEILLVRKLKHIGFKNFQLFLVDHHTAHAACAAYCSPFSDSTVLTIDGVGDGLSASVQLLQNGKLTSLAKTSAQDSLGVFFELITFLLNMRELEDEGKVMCLADMAHPDLKNPMLDFFTVDGLTVKAAYSPEKMFLKLKELAFKLPWEQFAWMGQKTLEAKLVELFKNALNKTQLLDTSWAGGVASNIKANQKIRLFSGLKNWFVFPHMGDGGLALGAALYVQSLMIPNMKISFTDPYLGPSFTEDEIAKTAKNFNLTYKPTGSMEQKGAEILADGNILLWFQGRMEYGPRALGNRSILASAENQEAKTLLNKILKRRSWFQPFCPTILFESANHLLEDWDGNPSPFMTMGYQIKPEQRKKMEAVTGPDGSSRPQLLQNENLIYRNLLENYQKLTGYSSVLNTSFNRHGEPLVCSPEQAFSVFLEAGFPYLIIGPYLFENPNSDLVKKFKNTASRKSCVS